MKLEGNGGRQLGIRHDLRLLIPNPFRGWNSVYLINPLIEHLYPGMFPNPGAPVPGYSPF